MAKRKRMMCVNMTPSERISIVDHGEIGIAIVLEEKRGGGTRWATSEEVLVPRAHVVQVADTMRSMVEP